MLWRKKRRLPMSGLSLIYMVCGCVLVLGHLYMMHSAFIQFFDDPRNVYAESVQRVSSHLRLVETLRNIPALALPDPLRKIHATSHIKFNEPKLRRLMNNDIYKSKLAGETNDAYIEIETSQNFQKKNSKQNIDKEGKEYHDLLFVSDSELRAVLNKTSNCVKLQSLTNKEYVASGWTKAVYKTNLEGHPVALKTIDLSGHDMTKCGQLLTESHSFCYKKASQKILKELLLLRALKIPNVVQVNMNQFKQ